MCMKEIHTQQVSSRNHPRRKSSSLLCTMHVQTERCTGKIVADCCCGRHTHHVLLVIVQPICGLPCWSLSSLSVDCPAGHCPTNLWIALLVMSNQSVDCPAGHVQPICGLPCWSCPTNLWIALLVIIQPICGLPCWSLFSQSVDWIPTAKLNLLEEITSYTVIYIYIVDCNG